MPAKRAKKKTTTKRAKKTARKSASPTKRKGAKPIVIGIAVAAVLSIGGLVAAYYFGSFETRERFHRVGIWTLDLGRTPNWMPRPIVSSLDKLHDGIPGSEGFAIEGGELGREESHFLAGQPRSNRPVQLLRNRSYFNLYSVSDKQPLCVALRLTNKKAQDSSSQVAFVEDPRIKNLNPDTMRLGNWGASHLAPVTALAREHGQIGAKEANLFTNLLPMTENFAQDTWAEVIQQFALRYPKRFNEVWLYLGPVYSSERAKLTSGASIPNAFYAVIYDITEAGGLRALALLVPTEATGADLEPYITSIAEIELQTGLQFTPGLEAGGNQALSQWVPPALW